MKLKKVFLILSGAVLSTGIFSPGFENFVLAEDGSVETLSFDEKVLGEYFSVPNKTIKHGDSTKNASFKVISPSGATYFDNELIANEVGQWKVVYYALFDNYPVEDIYTFSVKETTYKTKKSSFSIGTNEEYFRNSGSGINLTLQKDDVFECAEFLDLAKLTASTSFIEFGLAPSSKGTRELTELTVRLTDIYDENNYVDYIFHDPNVKEASYPGLGTVECSFTGQDVMMGMEYIKRDQTSAEVFTEKYIVDNNGYGSYLYFSFTGDYYETTRYKDGYADPLAMISFDVTNSHCLVLNKHNSNIASPRYPDGKKLIADLSRTDYSNDATNIVNMTAGKHGFTKPFKGFKDNKAKLSIFGSGFTGNECHIFISTIAGKKVQVINDVYTVDTLKPIIDVDTLNYSSDNLPLGKTNVPYTLFDAKVVDNFTKTIDLHKNIYKLSGNTKTYSLPIINNSFTPKEAGQYQLEYRAVDGSNNEALKSFIINVQDNVDLPTINPFFENLPTTAKCGQTIELPIPTVTSSSGEANVAISVKIGSKEIEINNNSIFLNQKGKYKITYTVSDYINQKQSVVAYIDVTPDEKPILYKDISCYPSFIAGKKYKLDNTIAYDYNTIVEDKPLEIESSIIASYNGQNITIDENGEFVVPNVDDGNLRLIYRFYGNKTLSVIKNIPIVKMSSNNVKGNDIINYFITEDGKNITKEANDKAVSFTFYEEGKIEFINKIPTHSAEFLLNIGNSNKNYANKINVIFTDSIDSSKVVKVSFIAKQRNALTSSMQVNDGELISCKGNFTGKSSFNFIFDTKNNEVVCDLINRVTIDSYLNGQKFEGFYNDSCFVTFEIEELTEGRSFVLDVMTIAGQRTFLNARGDKISPTIEINGEAKHRYQFGEIIETFSANAFDVFQPISSLSLSILDSEYEPIKLLDGTIASNLDPSKTYKFKMDFYGKCFASYSSDDGIGNSVDDLLVYVVEDEEKPTLNGVFDKILTVKAGELVKFDKVTFSDNFTKAKNINYVCYAKDPNGIISRIADGTGASVKLEYRFELKGEWTIYWSAQDENGNTSFRELTVIVK